MCGIVAYTGTEDVAEILLNGLKRLEYRGYDSAGIAVLNGAHRVAVRRTPGRVEDLARLIARSPMEGAAGIGHTRWATHGVVNEANSHPHTSCDGNVVLVHNGIVENYVELKDELVSAGHAFTSDTDTEVVVHLIESFIRDGSSIETAMRQTAGRLRGAGTFVAASTAEGEKIVGMRLGNAGGIVVGLGETGTVMASDLPAVLPFTNRVVYLNSREMAVICPESATYFDLNGNAIEKEVIVSGHSAEGAEKGAYPHFMLKEIYEQAESVASAMRGRVGFEAGKVELPEFPFSDDEVRDLKQIVVVGMGTSLHAGMVGATMIESLARIPSRAENASEFRYRDPVIDSGTLVISISQSGETADTLAAMEAAGEAGAKQVWVGETEGSQAMRMADGALLIRAGQEIGVASTKTMANTVVVLYLLAVYLAKVRGAIGDDGERGAVQALAGLPGKISDLLAEADTYRSIADRVADKQHLLYLGRGGMFPAALEGALKMKEIAYIHAEGYAAGEMKHGVNALISDAMPTVALAPAGALHEKMVSSINEVKARGGDVIAVITEGDSVVMGIADAIIELPRASEQVSAMLSLVPMQLLAYYTCVKLGHDPDKPRNLAKTVTVE